MTIDDVMTLLLLGSIYFLPTTLALWHRSAGWPLCLFVNLFFGWTVVGWIACIVLAALPDEEALAHRNRVRRARDEFYLREQEKFAATK